MSLKNTACLTRRLNKVQKNSLPLIARAHFVQL